jgi:hypothetical protein
VYVCRLERPVRKYYAFTIRGIVKTCQIDHVGCDSCANIDGEGDCTGIGDYCADPVIETVYNATTGYYMTL